MSRGKILPPCASFTVCSALLFLSGRRLLWQPPRQSSRPPQESMLQDNSLFRLIMGLEQYMCQRGDFLAEDTGTCP